MRDLSPQRLRYFHEVTITGSIRGAAEKLNTAPSVITRQIRLLEDEIGAKLFERSVAGSVPTEAAEELLNYWKACRLQAEDLEQKLNRIRNLGAGHVRVAASEGFLPGLRQQVVMPFGQSYPDIRFTIEIQGVAEIVEAVANGFCHIGLAFNPPASQRVVSVADAAIPLHLAVGVAHPFFDLPGPISIQKAFSHPLVMLSSHYGIRKMLDQIAYSEKAEPRAALTTNSLHLAVEHAIHSAFGTFIDPFHIAEHQRAGRLRALRVEHPLLGSGQASLLVRAGQGLPTASQAVIDWILNKSSVFARRD